MSPQAARGRRSAVLALALALACLAGAPRAEAFLFGRSGKLALLWVPDRASLDYDELNALLKRHPDAKLTIALSPQDVPEQARTLMAEHAAEGRVEFALRIPGDPILPLIARFRSRDAVDRVALGRVEYKKIFGDFPSGLVPGDGALTPSSVKPLEHQGFSWAAVGDAAFRTPWYTSGDLIAVPFHVPASTSTADILESGGARAVVLDEPGGPVPPGGGLEVLERLLSDEGGRWTSVRELLDDMSPYAVGPEEWPGWSGSLEAWTGEPIQKAAWELYAMTARELQEYQNSGSARLWTLNRATTRLYEAQASRYFRAANLSDPAVEKEFRSKLRRVYRTIRKSYPKALLTSLRAAVPPPDAEPGAAAARPEEPAPADEELEHSVRSGAEQDGLWFENPEDSVASAPEPPPELQPGTTAAQLWTLRALRVSWDDASVTFRFGVDRLNGNTDIPGGFDSLMLDLYMDLNHLAGRGSTVLLPSRRGFVSSLDAWEYSLVVHGWGAELYRSLPGHPPALAEKLQAAADLDKGEISVTVPRGRLRGNPARWGYLLVSLAVGAEKPLRTPPDPAAGPNGTPILGLLGPLEAQKTLISQEKRSYRRFSMLRMD